MQEQLHTAEDQPQVLVSHGLYDLKTKGITLAKNGFG